jgi:hypothetical protein
LTAGFLSYWVTVLEPDVSTIPDRLGEPRVWVDPPQGTFDVWTPVEDLHGLAEASIAVARARGRSYESLSPAQTSQRVQLLDMLGALLAAERKLLLRDFAKYLGRAIAADTK